MCLFAIDIGNTTINFGVFKANKLIFNFKLSTNKPINCKKDILSKLNKDKIKASQIGRIVVCSVVPKQTPILIRILKKNFRSKPLLISKNILIPIRNRYKKPRQVGQDRLVNAYAGLKLFGPGLILIDFGTAITFDIVSKKGEYLGGLILPGIDMSFEALNKKTALLPRVKIKSPKSLIGSNTQDCINNGVVYGVAGACDAIVDRLQKRFKCYRVIATGGNANLIKKFSKKITKTYPHLTLEGLRLISNLSN